EIAEYHNRLSSEEKNICETLFAIIDTHLNATENKIWHAHPVWFINDNPIAGYSKLKAGIRLMFWSGADFEEPSLEPGSGKFKDASILYTDASQIIPNDLKRWLEKSEKIQWDYKNLVKRKGVLVKL